MRKLLLFFFAGLCGFSKAQTIQDGLMMPEKTICTGFMFNHDRWTNYWEGDLKRDNGNIGSVTTQAIMWAATYGVTDKINVIAMIPYVKTEASKGTLTGMEGIQDLTLAVKYNFFSKDIGESKLKTFAALTYSTPLSDYSFDFLPLSIGMGSTNLSYRATAFYRMKNNFYVNASGAYTWRSNVTLDRPSYFTNGQIYHTDEVKMPNVFDYVISVGYQKGPLQVDVNYMQQNTLGGGDIRRQDMPFVSNRMNFSKVGFFVMYYVAVPKGLAVRAGSTFTIAGKNVGESTTLSAGLMYTIRFAAPKI